MFLGTYLYRPNEKPPVCGVHQGLNKKGGHDETFEKRHALYLDTRILRNCQGESWINQNFLDPKLNKIIVESIHTDVVEAMAAKGKIVYDMTPDELDNLFKTIAM